MAVFLKGSPENRVLLKKALKAWHPELDEHSVKVELLQAYAPKDKDGNPTSAALKAHGVAAMASVRIVNQRDRALGVADAVVSVDGDRWDELSEPQQLAVLDHELMHLELRYDDEGAVVRDASDRPKLVIRLHDYHFGWFRGVAERHGQHSMESRQARRWHDESGPIFLSDDVELDLGGAR